MDVINYVVENALILIPALYVLGIIIKQLDKIPDKYIPLILLFFGVSGSILIMGVSIDSLIQGVLVTGACVLSNQTVKQLSK